MPLLRQEVIPVSPRDGTYTLFVPVDLPSSLVIQGDAEGEIEGLHVWIRNRGEGRVEVIVRGFPSEESARAGFERLKGWLVWASLEYGQGLRFPIQEETIEWFETPPPNGEQLGGARAFADGGSVIYPTGERLVLVWARAGQFVSLPPAQHFFDRLSDASDLGVSAPDDTIRAGVDLFLATSWETSLYAKFLTLVNVLEALKEQPLLGSGVQQLVDQWLQELKLALKAGEVEPDEAESLRSSLERLRRRSIASSIRSLVLDKLDDPGAAGLASTIYGDRSKLVHEGEVPERLGEHVTTLQHLVPNLLRSLLANPSVGDGSGS